MEMHLGNTTQITANTYGLINSIRESPRWTVHYVRALAVVAVINTFLSIALGLYRRSSNRWIVHKGFFAAAVLSVSLGTYGIGLMQSSQVKSEMYPVWTVSLFALFNCIDPVTTYSGFDYIGTLLKMVFGICLNCGYVLVMIVSANSNYTGNTTIVLLSVITFIKGFHRSLSLVQQSTMRKEILNSITNRGFVYDHGSDDVTVDFFTGSRHCVTMADIVSALYTEDDEQAINRELWCMCAAVSLSLKLQCHFLVLGYHTTNDLNVLLFTTGKSQKFKMKVIETELAFLYDIFFTGNAFNHYYQAKAASFWALASFIGICSVGIAVAVSAAATPTPGAMAMTGHHHGGSTDVLDTTTADLVITFGILVSLALLQLLHLIQCWTSNWARLAVACAYATEVKKRRQTPYWQGRWLRLKLSIATSINLFDKHLWQNKICQYSELREGKLAGKKKSERSCKIKYLKSDSLLGTWSKIIHDGVKGALEEFGLGYVKEVLRDLLGRGINKVGAVSLDEDVKDSIGVFIRDLNLSNILEKQWLSNSYYHPLIRLHLPYFHGPGLDIELHGYRYTICVMMWHVATWYCEQLEQEQEKKKKKQQQQQQQQQDQDGLSKAEEGRTGCWGSAAREQPLANKPDDPKSRSESNTKSKRPTRDQNRRVANALSKYCAYLVVSAPELLPGPASEVTRAYKDFVSCVERDLEGSDGYCELWTKVDIHLISETDVGLRGGVALAKLLLADYPGILSVDDPWEVLAGFWVRMLVYAAPYGNMEAHRQRLAQGGEFITHLWAMLYHRNVREWKLPEHKAVCDISTVDKANRILKGHRAVIAFFDQDSMQDGFFPKQFAAASRLVNHICYRTTNPDVARVFEIPAGKGCPTLIFLNENLKPTIILYDGQFRAYDIACFVWNKCREDREAITEMIDSNSREAGNSPSSSD